MHYESLIMIGYLYSKILIQFNSFETLLFYCLRIIENNRNTKKTIDIAKCFYLNAFATSTLKICQSWIPTSPSKNVLQAFQFSID